MVGVRSATSTVLGGALAALSLLSLTAADGCQTLNGNTFCKEVDHIKYENIGASGLGYSDVVKMDPNGCVCQKSELTYSGPLAPLDSEVSCIPHEGCAMNFGGKVDKNVY